ncbi:MAG: hypothetical protein AVDCRST_MAG89-5415, partial [uncultured Gemmatimonadetes bacterium]
CPMPQRQPRLRRRSRPRVARATRRTRPATDRTISATIRSCRPHLSSRWSGPG